MIHTCPGLRRGNTQSGVKIMKTLAELKQAEREYIKQIGGYWEMSEFDRRINKFSRAIVRAFRREHGEAWLGNVNLYDDQSAGFVEYVKGIVRNFEYRVLLPRHDQQLTDMIQARADAPYTGTKADGDLLDPIFDRIEAIGGICLNWV